MASSFIQYKENGFWLSDAYYEIVTAYFVLILDLEDSQILPSWLIELRDYYNDAKKGMFSSFNSLRLDQHITSEDRAYIYYNLIIKIEQLLKSKGETLSIDELSKITDSINQDTWVQDLETESIIKVLEFIKLMILGRLNIKASDPIDYSF